MNTMRMNEGQYRVFDELNSKIALMPTMTLEELDALEQQFFAASLDEDPTADYLAEKLIRAEWMAREREHGRHEPRTYCGILGCHNYTTSMARSDRMYLDGVWICPECAGRL